MQDNKKIIRAVIVSRSIGFVNPLVKDLQEKGYDVISVSSPDPELVELKEMGVRFIEVPIERHISLIKDFRSLCDMIKVFRKEKPAMVHSITSKAGLIYMRTGLPECQDVSILLLNLSGRLLLG